MSRRKKAVFVMALIAAGAVIALVINQAERRELEDRERKEHERELRRAEDERRRRVEEEAWNGSEKIRAARRALKLNYPAYEDTKQRQSVQRGIDEYLDQRAAERDSMEDFGSRMCLELLLMDLQRHRFIVNTPSKRREIVALVNRDRGPDEPRYTMEEHVRETRQAQAAFRIGLCEGYLRDLEERGSAALDEIIKKGRL